MDFNRNLRIVRTSGSSYPFPYKSNVLWVHHDENNNPVSEIWDHGKWVPVTGVGSGSGDIIIDTKMSDSSSNAIANKTVKKYIDGIASKTDASILSLNEGVAALQSLIDTLNPGYQFMGVATPETNPGTPDQKVFYIANGKSTYPTFGGIEVTEDEVVILYYDTAWHKLPTGIASQEKLTELESKVDEIIMDDVPFTFDGYIVNDQAGKAPGSFVVLSGYKSTDFTNVENADRIVAKLRQAGSVVALIAYYAADKVFISALAKEQQSDTEIVVNKSEFPSGTKYVRLCTQTSGNYPKYAHLYATSVIKIINSQIDDTLTKEGKIADSKTVGDRFAMMGAMVEEDITNIENSISAINDEVALNNSIFKTVPINHTLPLDMLIDFGVQGRVSGRLYWIQVKRQETKQSLTIHFTTTENPRTITGSQNLKNNNIIDSGICKYTVTDADNETLSVIIDWSKISVGDTFNYYPDEYVVKDSVFNGGLLSWNIIPIQDKTITSEKLTDDAFDSTLTKQGKIADAKAVGDVLREAGTLTEEMQGVFPVNTYGERYWAVCGDSITSANHAKNGVFLIDGISDDDPYCPIDGYSKLNSYKRKNYAYYFAKEHTIKWANYGYGGTTLSHCPSIGHPVSQTIPFVDDRIENLKEGVDWDFITIFFGYNDFMIGPIAEREKWLKSQYGTDIQYPETDAQIGQEGFATEEQKAACDAVTGTVGEITYNDNNAYFFAKFFGLIDDSTKETFLGAYNYALEYLIRKYTKAKIMIVAPFFSKYKELFTKGIHAMADKWCVTCFDFTDVPFWYMNPVHQQMPFLNDAEGSGGYWYTETGVGLPRTLDGYNMSRYSTDSLHPTNLGYRLLAEMFGNKMLNG